VIETSLMNGWDKLIREMIRHYDLGHGTKVPWKILEAAYKKYPPAHQENPLFELIQKCSEEVRNAFLQRKNEELNAMQLKLSEAMLQEKRDFLAQLGGA
jgi:hypothetical protein